MTASGPGAQDAPATYSAAQQPAWSGLAPMTPTWGAQPPLTAAPTAPTAPTAPAASPVAAMPARQVRAIPAEDAPQPGRVVGLAAVVAPQPAVPAPAAEMPDYFREQPPLRHVTARPLVEHPPLVQATDEYVGAPTQPLRTAPDVSPQPFPSQVAPRSEPAVEAMTDAGARFREALANLHNSGHPRYISPSEAAPQQATPPAAPPPQPARQPDEPPRLTHRRNTLAESRRLGLGAPVRRGADGDGGDGGE
ncbi:MAG TPA: hypothetical protein VE442_07935, partial [Jatrophihabitans sp.]|nr:hypothetical protein [Jatrophihabitans sp.]